MILVPAAGRSSRMGGQDKLTKPVDGTPLLARQVARALATGERVLVTLPADRPARAACLSGLSPRPLIAEVADAQLGMSRSLVAGARAARALGEDLLVLLPDMPDIETADLIALIAVKRPADPVVRATAEDGTPGHPVLFDNALLGAFDDLAGDTGAAPVIRAHKDAVRLVPLKGRRACRDLDTPADWAAYSGGGAS